MPSALRRLCLAMAPWLRRVGRVGVRGRRRRNQQYRTRRRDDAGGGGDDCGGCRLDWCAGHHCRFYVPDLRRTQHRLHPQRPAGSRLPERRSRRRMPRRRNGDRTDLPRSPGHRRLRLYQLLRSRSMPHRRRPQHDLRPQHRACLQPWRRLHQRWNADMPAQSGHWRPVLLQLFRRRCRHRDPDVVDGARGWRQRHRHHPSESGRPRDREQCGRGNHRRRR